ncbi:MAG: hypothetical protein HY099_04580 [Nitrospirae bacterium]|nr:hypothetical protein [Nitrospirota bacterium]
MFKFLKIILAVWVLFIAVSVIRGGGDDFRSMSDKSGTVIKYAADLLADKADSLSSEAEAVKEKIMEWKNGDRKFAEKRQL